MSFFEEKNPEMDRYLEAHYFFGIRNSEKAEERDISENHTASYDFRISAGKIADDYFPDDAAEKYS